MINLFLHFLLSLILFAIEYSAEHGFEDHDHNESHANKIYLMKTTIS